jgi:exodeoxyribonuclease III
MPPKKSKSTNKDDERATEKKVTSVPKLTQKTLTSDKLIDDPAPKAKSKKFVVGAATTGKSSSHRWKLGDGKTPNKLTISSWNVNGIRSVLKKSELQNYVASKKPDMICINETKIDEKAYDK